VLAEVEGDVDERVPELTRRLEVRPEIALAPELPATSDERVDPHRDARREPLHPTREAHAVVSLGNDVQMVVLHRVVEDAKPLRRRARNFREDDAHDDFTAHRRRPTHGAHGGVDRDGLLERLARLVRLEPDVRRRRLPPGARPDAAAGRKLE